ncbi:hypothetical protein [Sanguibacteroides justesenii]|uniref:Uncharacterized protein n=1 Tax=Sanguibacteroides justesenii TaxID=1547597 RepID=A0A0C3RCU5_9PORP|nr:hypothetical protein [Sanguibacteroides justesenii]KIO43901.1 hypothetical protein BA92_10905 [Sanguibacteroides justesenii]KIO46513.1 hypothetical protein IE90_03965 [Sanguibacteroides justesenii]PXZ44063.1 hypothetical protein DMB45_08605 [Sanguibacteroides justesenii]
MNFLGKTILVLLLIGVVVEVKARNSLKSVVFKVSGDIVSSYIWRGAYNAGASIQPTLSMGIGAFSLTAWGSKEISGTHKEIDLTAAYRWGKFNIFVADYWWEGEKLGDRVSWKNNNYFHFDNRNTAHHVEVGIGYVVSDKFPLCISWSTMVWGADKKDNEKQNYSSYAEMTCPFSVKNVDLNFTLGFSPYESELYAVRGFSITNIELGASKEIQFTKAFSLPVFTRIVFDPAHEDAHFVLGFTLR